MGNRLGAGAYSIAHTAHVHLVLPVRGGQGNLTATTHCLHRRSLIPRPPRPTLRHCTASGIPSPLARSAPDAGRGGSSAAFSPGAIPGGGPGPGLQPQWGMASEQAGVGGQRIWRRGVRGRGRGQVRRATEDHGGRRAGHALSEVHRVRCTAAEAPCAAWAAPGGDAAVD